MLEVVIINTGERLDVEGGIKYTFQTSEIGNISEVNSSWGWSMKFPKSINNIQIFEGLGLVGSTSGIPYMLIEVSVNYSGVPIVEKGNLKITETLEKEYKGHVVSGIVDFFNNIKNTTLENIVGGQGNLSHDKTLQTVVDSWTGSDPYRYIIADYNGELNADASYTDFKVAYLTPSVNVKWLMDLIFTTFGWTYTGLENIDEDWMTYGNKVQEEGEVGLTVGILEAFLWNRTIQIYSAVITEINHDVPFQSGEINPTYIDLDSGEVEIMDAMEYDIIVPQIKIQDAGGVFQNNFYIYINGIISVGVAASNHGHRVSLGNLSIGDKISVKHRILCQYWNNGKVHIIGNFQIVASNAVITDYQSASMEYNSIDFIKEVMMRNASIAIPNVKNKSIKFMNIDDRINADVVDWSDKFVRRTSEKYAYNNYAIKNYLRHSYEEEDQEYHDGSFDINNLNLEQKHTVFKSKTYPSNQHPSLLKDGITIAGYKLYDIEMKNNGQVYKPLNDRFYFMRGEMVNDVGQIKLDGTAYSTYYKAIPRDYDVIVNEEYPSIAALLNTVKVMDIELILNLFDIRDLRFDVKYYFKQESGFFLLNKLTWDSSQTITKAEFIKLEQQSII